MGDMTGKFKLTFHPEAASRFDQLADEVLKTVRSFGPVHPPPQPIRRAEIHPVFNLTENDIIGEISVKQQSVNRLGEETARFWNSNGVRVGWEGNEFQSIKELARRFENADPIKDLVSHEFLL